MQINHLRGSSFRFTKEYTLTKKKPFRSIGIGILKQPFIENCTKRIKLQHHMQVRGKGEKEQDEKPKGIK